MSSSIGATSAIEVALSLLEGVLSSINQSGIATDVQLVESAIESLVQFKSTPVTFGQLEDLRITPQW